jgi:hypothetical protein
MNLVSIRVALLLALSVVSAISFAAGTGAHPATKTLVENDYRILDRDVVGKVERVDALLNELRPPDGPWEHIGFWPFQTEQQEILQIAEDLGHKAKIQKDVSGLLVLNVLHSLVNIAPLVSPSNFYIGEWHVENDEDISAIRRNIRKLALLSVNCDGFFRPKGLN